MPESSQVPDLNAIYAKYLANPYQFFVEVGAYNGLDWSNTRGLALQGYSGILIEPHPSLAKACRDLYADNDKITIEECACGKAPGAGKLYLAGTSTTLSLKTVRFFHLENHPFVQVTVDTLDNILARNGCPARYDVLVIDTEGYEMEVLLGYDIEKHKPTIAIVETHSGSPFEEFSGNCKLIDALFADHGYTKYREYPVDTVYVLHCLRSAET